MEEEVTRFGHFLDNLKVADLRNEKERMNNGTAIHGVTRFSDMSQDEFNKFFLSSFIAPSEGEQAQVAPYTGAATSVDWSGTYTTPVKNQAQCGISLALFLSFSLSLFPSNSLFSFFIITFFHPFISSKIFSTCL